MTEIIIRHLLGKTSSEEERQLEAWRRECEANEQVFQRLTSPKALEEEWRRRKAVGYEHALEQMKQRIGVKEKKAHPFWLRPAFYRTLAACAVVAFAAFIVGRQTANHDGQQAGKQLVEQNGRPLKPGSTKAFLTLSNGEQIELSEATSVAQLTDLQASSSHSQTNGDKASDTHAKDKEAARLTLSVPRGGEFKIELEDGTEVWLNAQSKLIYPEQFSDTERRVQVEGEAYFKVARNEQKPFYVEADNQVIKVLGTEFNVHAYADDKSVQTTLVTGKIAMQQKGADDREMILAPGHQAVFDKSVRSIKVKRVDTEVMTSWKDGMFVFEDQDLASIMQTLSRWYDFEYEFADKESPKTVFMGRIPRYSEFDDVLEIIQISGGLNLKLQGRKLTITKSK